MIHLRKKELLKQVEKFTSNYLNLILRTQTPAKNFNFSINNLSPNQILVGPYRVFPGRLSVNTNLQF